MDLCWQSMSLLFSMLSRLVIAFLPRSILPNIYVFHLTSAPRKRLFLTNLNLGWIKTCLEMECFRELPDRSNSDSSLGIRLFIELHTHSAPSICCYFTVFHAYDSIAIRFLGYKNVEDNKIWIEQVKML